MSSDDIAEFFWDSATVEQLLGTSGYGIDLFAAPVTLSPVTGTGVYTDNSRRLVRSSTGEEVISETTLYTYPTVAGLFTLDARVTLSDGTVTRVITANLNNSGPLDLPDHLAVSLT